jgi:hypothetical protein
MKEGKIYQKLLLTIAYNYLQLLTITYGLICMIQIKDEDLLEDLYTTAPQISSSPLPSIISSMNYVVLLLFTVVVLVLIFFI